MRIPHSTLASSLAGSAIALALSARAAHAQYLDPGAGSIIVQAVIAVAVGAAATLKLYWSRISTLLSQRRNRDTEHN
jgi:hypothetical protein